MRKELVAKILHSVASAIDRLDDGQLQIFAENLRKSAVGATPGRLDSKNRHAKIDPIKLEMGLTKLSEFKTRQEGAAFLEDLALSRKELEALAKMRNIHVIKDDNVAKIKEKLIENIIGARLSSTAIRGG